MPSSLFEPTRDRVRAFRLTRFFSITSLTGIVVVTACLFWTYRELTVRHLVQHESLANADMSRAFANAVWATHRPFVLGSSGRTRGELLADPMLGRLREDVRAKMKGLKIAKVKIYNLDGLTVFSTDRSQIGEDKSANPGFMAARVGGVASHITFREKFDAFEGTLNNRNLIASYVPIQPDGRAAPEAVIEVYSDVTELLQTQSRAQWQVAAVVSTLLALLYIFLYFVVRRADRIIAAQERERAAKEQEIRHQAYHDSLTSLPNRAYFSERLSEAVSLAGRQQHSCALMFIDLDRFKIVNDSLGHHAGDLLLQQISKRLQSCLRDSDLLFRMGGDEFTVILPEIDAPEDAAHVASRILEEVARPVAIHEHELNVGASVGIATFPDDGADVPSLLKNADAAMYNAKASGRGCHAFYQVAMNQRALQRLNLESELKSGFRNGEFQVHYQPRLSADTGEVVAVEALLRWSSPSRGMVLPGEFIGVLEETGMMTMVGEWVLRTACTQLGRWRELGFDDLRVSVNVSSTQFESPSFVMMVKRVLEDTGASAPLLELEITESMLIRDTRHAHDVIDALKALGLRVTIDDFGTGYSSLNYLRYLDVDYLKVDRSFVTEVACSARDRAVATAISDLAQALDITLVAEGIENEEQVKFFSGIRCEELQGFLFCKPLPIGQLEQFLARHSIDAASVAKSPHISPGPQVAAPTEPASAGCPSLVVEG